MLLFTEAYNCSLIPRFGIELNTPEEKAPAAIKRQRDTETVRPCATGLGNKWNMPPCQMLTKLT
ncbi:hypothetical protein NBRC116589_41850 [Ruegeria sp. HU-ET01832]